MGRSENPGSKPKPVSPSYLTDPVSRPDSKFRASRAGEEAKQAKINDCEREILQAMADEERDVWAAEQFEDLYEPEIYAQAIKRLRKARKIALGEEIGLRGHKVQVIRRR